jgi:CheY-like chemotaxis protein
MGKRVLVVDDEKDILDFVAMILADTGYEVDCAGDGSEALAKMRARRPDLVVLDLMMPVMDGWDFLQHLHQIPNPPAVVILSAAPDEWKAFRAGAWECLSKPLIPREFLETCRRALSL